jgi:hypothetical protein
MDYERTKISISQTYWAYVSIHEYLFLKTHNIFSPQYNYFFTFISPPHDMFRPQTAIIKCLVYAKTVALYKCSVT